MLELADEHKPKTFAILAFAEVKPDFVSRRIEAAIGANYSHVGILVGDTVYHATGKGFHKQPLEDVLEGGATVIRRKVSVPVVRECCALAWLEARLETKYSLVQYLGFAFPFLRFLPLVNNGRRETVCSEVGADFVWDNAPEPQREIVRMAFGDCDFVDPKKCLDVLAGIFGEDPVSHLKGGSLGR